jgi:hypothetical protein
MNGTSRSEQQLLHSRLKWVAFLLIGLAALLFANGFRLYKAHSAQSRANEQIDAIDNELNILCRTYGYIHALGENRREDVRVNLNLSLCGELAMLEGKLISTDENTRAFAKRLVGLIELDKKRHPAYYAIPAVNRTSANGSRASHNCVPMTNELQPANP